MSKIGQWIITQEQNTETMNYDGLERERRDLAYYEYSVLGYSDGWFEPHYDSLRRYQETKRGELSTYI